MIEDDTEKPRRQRSSLRTSTVNLNTQFTPDLKSYKKKGSTEASSKKKGSESDYINETSLK